MTTKCQRPDWTPLATNANNHNLPSTNDVQLRTGGGCSNDHNHSNEPQHPIPGQDHQHHQHHHQQQQHQQQQVAPLASLDCSITESISINNQVARESARPPEANNSNHASSNSAAGQGSCPDTPTLSDYFDCDHFSDMVDDSLFEITNAGCLSKSVFGAANRPANRSSLLSSSSSSRSMVVVSGGQLIGGRLDDDDDDDRQEDHRSGQTTPTNEPDGRPADFISRPKTEPPGAQVSSPLQLINSKLAGEAHQTKGLVALMAHFQPYDYSSTSSVPGAGQLTRARPARPRPAEPDLGDSVASSSPAVVANQPRAAPRRKTRSNPDVNEHQPAQTATTATMASSRAPDSISGDEGTTTAAAARSNRPVVAGGVKRSKSSRDRLGPSSSSSSSSPDTCPICRHKQESSKKGRRRFTFSLFNLFTGATGDHDKSVCPHRKSLLGGGQIGSDTNSMCQMKAHKQQHSSTRKHQDNNNNNKKSGAGRRALHNNKQQQQHQTGESGLALGPSQLKSRDSIRVTNQRKLRSGSASNVGGARIGRPQQPDEILLDLSSRPGKQPHNYDTSSALNNNNNNHCQMAGGGAPPQPRARAASASVGRPTNGQPPAMSAGRHNKSVKFTMPPDRVMIVSKSQSAGRHLGATSSTSCLPGGHLQPSAPIIKQQRPSVPKSSSYCQTDSSKTLDAMLARYEGNSMLIDEIIEKLKLGETIASNLSALDAEQGAVDSRPPPIQGANDDHDDDDHASKCPCNRQSPTTPSISRDNERTSDDPNRRKSNDNERPEGPVNEREEGRHRQTIGLTNNGPAEQSDVIQQ